MPGGLVILFARYPEEGRVMTRLSAEIGAGPAVALYRCFVKDMLDTLGGTGVPFQVYVHPADMAEDFGRKFGPGLAVRPQEGEDLGARMANAFRGVFEEGYERAVLMGSDLPDLQAEIITGALGALSEKDAVLGPASDGGYYLIGFRRDTFHPGVFEGVQWGTAEVYEGTVRALGALGIEAHMLQSWHDVDTLGDLIALIRRNQGTAFTGSTTYRQISKMGPAK